MNQDKECHCGKDGHALNSINCPVHGTPKGLEEILAELEKKAEKQSEEWFEDFGDGNGTYNTWMAFVKPFITQAYSIALQKGREEADWYGESLLEARKSGRAEERERIRKLVAELEFKAEGEYGFSTSFNSNYAGYNKALTDILSSLEESK